nr:591_t:CDS:2 [Entrophospora candida]
MELSMMLMSLMVTDKERLLSNEKQNDESWTLSTGTNVSEILEKCTKDDKK